ncbi:MAG TPA: alpha/beta hydrolase [Dehalococcoidia bacterium]|nr:alpha/beta hydrolase [Dehalococcoidia bacterium]
MDRLDVGGTEIYYERHGEAGEPLVFVHGYTGDITDWRHQIPEFSRTHRVLVMDLRGHGRSAAPADRSSYTVARMAEEVEAVIAHAGFGRYHLVGHSMGGLIAQEITLRHQVNVLTLTLEDSGYSFNLSRNQAVAQYYAARLTLAEQQGMEAVANLPSVGARPPHQSVERAQEEKERLSRMSVDGFIGAWQALETAPSTRDRLREIVIPTLIICGALDPLLPASERMAELIPDATLEVIPEAGHSPQYERPDLFNGALRRHLEKHAVAAVRPA